MIRTEDVVKHIEKMYQCKLYDYQIKLLDNIIHGKITNAPRHCGRTFIINGYADYLEYLHNACKYDSSIEVDDYISGEDVINNKFPSFSVESVMEAFRINPEIARRAYNIDFTKIIELYNAELRNDK